MRFERAVRIGNPSLVVAATHELPKPVQLRDALRVVLVLAVGAPEQFPMAGGTVWCSAGERAAASAR